MQEAIQGAAVPAQFGTALQNIISFAMNARRSIASRKMTMRIDQIAYYCSSREDGEALKKALGLEKSAWIEDIVTGKSFVYGLSKKQINIAHLQFNYELGIELEIIRYLTGPNWHAARNSLNGNPRFFSHVGVHLDDGEDFPKSPGLLVQETWTQKHTSEYLTTGPGAGRKYHYRIHELAPNAYIKYIKRLHPEAKS